MQAKFAPVWVVTWREVRDQFRDWRIIFPVLVLTLVFPGLMNFISGQALGFVQRYGGELVGDRIIPFLMLIVGFFPISISLVVALESFVGEKERRSLEPLLSSPLTDGQLYLSKLLAALILPLLASYLGTTVYLIGVYRGTGWVAPPLLLVQTVLLVAVQALVMVSGAVVISTQTTSVRAANLLASFIILPMALLIQAESMAMFWGNYNILWLSILGQIVLAGLLVRMGVAHFNREELLGRELDSLNLAWAWRIFRRAFIGQAVTLRQWMAEVRQTQRKLSLPTALTGLLFIASVVVGSLMAGIIPQTDTAYTNELVHSQLEEAVRTAPMFSLPGVPLLWLHNLRAIFLAALVGLASFSIGGMLVLLLPPLLVGFMLTAASQAGFSPWELFVGLVLPHGLFEIPALLVAGGAVLNLGAALLTPMKDKTIGEAWLTALAEWARVMVVVVAPLMLAAALVEALITPQVALFIFRP